jgi:CRISPR-associated protein Cas2
MNRGVQVKLLITYDVNTETGAGRKRLRQMAKACQDYGQRVQNSVFECVADAGMVLKIKDRLIKIIDTEKDSLRFYMLGDEHKARAEHYGAKPSYDVNEPLIL